MHVTVNGVGLFVEVFGQKLAPDGPEVLERPTVVLLHGGPSDHDHVRRSAVRLAEVAQVIVYDHRGCGRSDPGDPALWNMAQWGDDVRGLCEALRITSPIVLGTSFGGFVAQSYAIRHPGHAAKLGFLVTGARQNLDWSVEGFRKHGGDAAATAFRAFGADPNPETLAEFLRSCRAFYNVQRVVDAEAAQRTRANLPLLLEFFRRSYQTPFDFRSDLAAVKAPVLIVGGDEDPILPPVFQDELEQALTSAPKTRIRFAKAGHQLDVDVAEAYDDALRRFVVGDSY